MPRSRLRSVILYPRLLASRVLDSLTGIPCGVCGHGVRRYLPLGAEYRSQVRDAGFPYDLGRLETLNVESYACPYCGAADRDRLLALGAADFLATHPEPLTVIDFAPSEPLSRLLRQQIRSRSVGDRYRTADLMMPGVDDRVDMTDLACYPSGSVDLFLCSHVLEHVSDDRLAMRELFRILRPGGRGLLLVPIVIDVTEIDEDPGVTDPQERWRRFGQHDHVRLYSRQGFIARLSAAGFVVGEHGRDHFGAAAFCRQGIAPGSVLYVAEKPAFASPGGDPGR